MSASSSSPSLVRGLAATAVVLLLSNGALLVALLSSEPAAPEPCDCAAEIAAAAAAGGLDPAALAAYGGGGPGSGEEPEVAEGGTPRSEPEEHARAFLEARIDAMKAEGSRRGIDVSPWVPAPVEVDAAIRSGGPETPEAQRVLDKLRDGHRELGLEFEVPAGPQGGAEGGP